MSRAMGSVPSLLLQMTCQPLGYPMELNVIPMELNTLEVKQMALAFWCMIFMDSIQHKEITILLIHLLEMAPSVSRCFSLLCLDLLNFKSK